MAIALEQSQVTTVDVPSASASTASWTPGSNELLLCFVAMRGNNAPDFYVTNVAGNGLTWAKALSEDDTQNNICLTVWRALGASPTAGAVTVTWGVDPISAVIQLMRFSGVATSGSSGSGAIGNTASTDTGASDTNSPSTSVTTSANNSRVLGLLVSRGQTVSVGAGFTAININQVASSGGNIARSSTEYKDVASSGTATTTNFSLSAVGDWAIAAIELLAAASNVVAPAPASATSAAADPTWLAGSLSLSPTAASVISAAALDAVIDAVTLAPEPASATSAASVTVAIFAAARSLTLKARRQLSLQG